MIKTIYCQNCGIKYRIRIETSENCFKTKIAVYGYGKYYPNNNRDIPVILGYGYYPIRLWQWHWDSSLAIEELKKKCFQIGWEHVQERLCKGVLGVYENDYKDCNGHLVQS